MTTFNSLDKVISLGFFKHYVETGVPDDNAINNLNVKVSVVLKELGFNHECHGCGEVFKTEIQLKIHEKKHEEHESQICGEVFKTSTIEPQHSANKQCPANKGRKETIEQRPHTKVP